MTARPLTTVASTIRRRRATPAVADRSAPDPDQRADDARLDELRGELVRELDRLAATDEGCSADFRRI